MMTNCGSFSLPFPTDKKAPKPAILEASKPKTSTSKPNFFPVSFAQFDKYFGVTLLGGKSTKRRISSWASAIFRPLVTDSEYSFLDNKDNSKPSFRKGCFSIFLKCPKSYVPKYIPEIAASTCSP